MIHPITRTIFKRELKSYFTTPIGSVLLIIFLLAVGQLTFEAGRGSFFLKRQADLSSFFYYLPWLFLLLAPAVSMRLWSEERRSGSIELLFTLPVTIRQAVIGKYFAAWCFLNLALFCTFPLVLTVSYLGSPDYGVITSGYIGASLMAAAYLAIGSFFSALTKNQVISFILSVVFCYMLLMAGSPPILEFFSAFTPGYFIELFESLSIIGRFENLQRGILGLDDIFFYVIMILGWLFAAMYVLEEKKAV